MVKIFDIMKTTNSRIGLSFLFVAGSYGGFHVECTASAFHVCMAFIAFTIFFYDAENTIGRVLNKEGSIKKRIDELNLQRAENVLARKGKSHMAEETSRSILEDRELSIRVKELESLLK